MTRGVRREEGWRLGRRVEDLKPILALRGVGRGRRGNTRVVRAVILGLELCFIGNGGQMLCQTINRL